jgi:hypothetical protein
MNFTLKAPVKKIQRRQLLWKKCYFLKPSNLGPFNYAQVYPGNEGGEEASDSEVDKILNLNKTLKSKQRGSSTGRFISEVDNGKRAIVGF